MDLASHQQAKFHFQKETRSPAPEARRGALQDRSLPFTFNFVRSLADVSFVIGRISDTVSDRKRNIRIKSNYGVFALLGPNLLHHWKTSAHRFWSDLFSDRQQQLYFWFQAPSQNTYVGYDCTIFDSNPVEHLPGIDSLRRCGNGKRG